LPPKGNCGILHDRPDGWLDTSENASAIHGVLFYQGTWQGPASFLATFRDQRLPDGPVQSVADLPQGDGCDRRKEADGMSAGLHFSPPGVQGAWQLVELAKVPPITEKREHLLHCFLSPAVVLAWTTTALLVPACRTPAVVDQPAHRSMRSQEGHARFPGVAGWDRPPPAEAAMDALPQTAGRATGRVIGRADSQQRLARRYTCCQRRQGLATRCDCPRPLRFWMSFSNHHTVGVVGRRWAAPFVAIQCRLPCRTAVADARSGANCTKECTP
jgi:hypothetical protein